MRLQKIKLAGFKSFVDPTTIELTEPLVAIVGPNGCGKSNIIDAIRWVMGESSAKNLRGEALTDVIFNGSTGRKPVGQATVELIFDNSDGSLGGEYSGFSEISIRRLVTRDNQSLYFLNGVRCRRRDITEIFLGTGLGPRSYAIIEQGMISRVIDAKPEELRAFLEEAAGISVYRKRRQETETRMRHTRENLARLEDLRQELDKQLERLKRQSESAAKYQEYKKIVDILETQLATLRWKNLSDQLMLRQQDIQKLNLMYEEKMAARASGDLEVEKLRGSLEVETEKFNQIQAEFYDLGSHLARTEQTLTHHKTREQELKEELISNNDSLRDIQQQTEQDKQQADALEQKLAELMPEMQRSETQATEYSDLLQQAEEKMREWNEKFESFQQDAAKSQRSAEVEKARIEQLEKQSREANTVLQRLQQEFSDWDLDKLKDNLKLLEAQMASAESDSHGSQARLDQLSQSLTKDRAELQKLSAEFDTAKRLEQTQQGQLVSLEALQRAALGKSDSKVKAWLESSQLEHLSRLGENIKVEAGFEVAVEMALGMALQALCLDSIEAINDKIHEFSGGELTLIEGNTSERKASWQNSDLNAKTAGSSLSSNHSELIPLISKISSSYPLTSLLAGIYVAPDLAQALRLRKNLVANESIVTQDGVWLGPNWLRLHKTENAEQGILERDQAIQSLQQALAQSDQSLSQLSKGIEALQTKIQTLDAERETFYHRDQMNATSLKELSGKLSAAQAKWEHGRTRVAKIQEEMAVQNQKQTIAAEETGSARLTLQNALDEMQKASVLRVALLEERDKLKDILQQVTQQSRKAQDVFHQQALKVEGLKTQKQAILQGIQRLETQFQHATKQNAKLNEAITESIKPQAELQTTLDKLLANRLEVENRLNIARQQLESAQQNLRQLEKQRNILEQEAGNLRQQIENLRIECQGFEVRLETYQDKLQHYNVTVEEVLKTLDTQAEEGEWAQKLEEMTKKIERLGAINLAAIEEYQIEAERKQYLDAQHKDLTEALETLENAIKKIDRETRQKFKETFDKVNQEFQALFPRLFGGGQAYLALEGEDLLESGVTVMARPPGKRNSTIHLLSGGEKALTAVSLVFSIFRLNPAPFCMLDEVDAPLDDANVGRFCQLVKHMSSTVQFIYVTHNKITMEMAHHLMGVTMKEPGVSRLVSVDVAKAYALATA